MHSSSVDLFPPAFCWFPKTLGRRHACIVPQSVRAFLLAESAPYCHYHLAMWALEVEALTIHIDPLIIIPIVIGLIVIIPILAPSHRHQWQEYTEKNKVHVEYVSGLEMPHWFGVLALLYCL